jgi:hypothetical protein
MCIVFKPASFFNPIICVIVPLKEKMEDLVATSLPGGKISSKRTVSKQKNRVRIEGNELYVLCNAQGTIINCAAGTIWITHEGDNRDYIISQGESYTITQKGKTVAMGLPSATFSIKI